jgi:hypothetical protein
VCHQRVLRWHFHDTWALPEGGPDVLVGSHVRRNHIHTQTGCRSLCCCPTIEASTALLSLPIMDAAKYTFERKLGGNRQSYPTKLCSIHEAATSHFVTESTILDFCHGKDCDSPESDR